MEHVSTSMNVQVDLPHATPMPHVLIYLAVTNVHVMLDTLGPDTCVTMSTNVPKTFITADPTPSAVTCRVVSSAFAIPVLS